MIDRIRIKQTARYSTNTNFLGVLWIPLIGMGIPFIISFITFGGATVLLTYGSYLNVQQLIGALLLTVSIPAVLFWTLFSIFFPIFLSYWSVKYYREIHLCGGAKVSPFEIIQSFSLKEFWHFFLKQLVTAIFTFLWTLVFIIPGIIKSFEYAMVPYIAIDEPELSILETIKRSREMMYGHKIDLLFFEFSFFFWYLAIGITFGLLALYVYPYVSIARIGFYYAISGKYPEEETERIYEDSLW